MADIFLFGLFTLACLLWSGPFTWAMRELFGEEAADER